MSFLDTFVAFDLETTGLDPPSAEILEIGAVRVQAGEPVAQFDQLVCPKHGIPLTISRMTGIYPDHVREAPEAAEAAVLLKSFVGEDPLVAHNAPFDLSFVNAVCPSPLRQRIYDSLELSRILLPRLMDHRLSTLLRFFQIETEEHHRAGEDAWGAAQVFMRLVDVLREKPLTVVQHLLRASVEADTPLRDVFEEVAGEQARGALSTKIRGGKVDPDCLRTFFNIDGEPSKEERSRSGVPKPLDVEKILDLFKNDGALAGNIPGYEKRAPQQEMTEAVCKAFNRSELLVVEAGTGTGKSMAYLIPAIYWGVTNSDRTVISTNTKNLQEQLFYQDLPQLRSALNLPFTSVLLKGRSNYLCLNKWNQVLREGDLSLTGEEKRMLLSLIVWAEETETGDIEEHSGFRLSKGMSVWSKLCSEAGSCMGARCPFADRCFPIRARRAAQRSHIVVVNHSLLFSDLSSENGILGDYRHLILDEAHNLEKVAAQYLGRELSIWRIRNIVQRLYSKNGVETGLLVSLRRRLSGISAKKGMRKAFLSQVEYLIELSTPVWGIAQDFFRALIEQMDDRRGPTPYVQKIRFQGAPNLFSSVRGLLDELIDHLTRLRTELAKLCDWLREGASDAFPFYEEILADLEGRRQECQEILQDFMFITSAEDDAYVYWVELPRQEESIDLRLFAAPLDVSRHLSEGLYERMATMVFTSATLTIRGNFKYVMLRLGLESLEADRVQTLRVGSPFDYARQALVCVPSFLPSPKAQDFQDAVERLIGEIASRTRRGMLVLFTSYGMLNRSYQRLQSMLNAEGMLLLGQGLDGARSHIMAQFKEDRSSVLFGTDSFWEGVDVPGEALEILMIAKLPFAVPTEPLVAAQMEKLEQEGKDPFLHYSVPEAVIKFRQGFGRLIRHRADRGVVVILDTRVVTTRYGRVFLDSLPTDHRVFGSIEEIAEGIEQWFLERKP